MRAKPGLMISSGISIDAMEVAEDLRQAVIHLAEHLGMDRPPLKPRATGRASMFTTKRNHEKNIYTSCLLVPNLC